MAALTKRNASLSEAEIEQLIAQKDAENTQNVIKKSIKLFHMYCKEKGIDGADELSFTELDDVLGHFYAELRKQNGELYAKKSLESTRYGLQRHFDTTRNVDIIKDKEFKHSNLVYKSMLVKLKDSGKAKVQHKTPIHKDDMAKIMQSSALDQSTPRGLQNKVFMDYMLYFANRGRENLREMTKDDLKIRTDPSGLRYVELVVDKLRKTDRGEGSEGPGQSGLMYETPNNPNMCPVTSFEKYVSGLNHECDAFWQRPKVVVKSHVWYDNVPVGKNTLYNKTKEISKEAGITRSPPYTNHCLRATSIQTLDSAGFEARDIMTVSGHKSESSIRSYSRTSEEKKKNMSAAISKLMPQSATSSAISAEPSQSNVVSNNVVAVPLENLVTPSFEPSTRTITLPPVIEEPVDILPSFDIDMDEEALLLTASQEEMVLNDITNSSIEGRDISVALGLAQSATTVRNTNTFNFYNCNVQLHQ